MRGRLALLLLLFGAHAMSSHNTISDGKFVTMIHDKSFLTEYSENVPNALCKSRPNGELFFKIKNICGANKLYPKVNADEVVAITHYKVIDNEKLDTSDIMTMCTNELPDFKKIHQNFKLDIFRDQKLFYFC